MYFLLSGLQRRISTDNTSLSLSKSDGYCNVLPPDYYISDSHVSSSYFNETDIKEGPERYYEKLIFDPTSIKRKISHPGNKSRQMSVIDSLYDKYNSVSEPDTVPKPVTQRQPNTQSSISSDAVMNDINSMTSYEIKSESRDQKQVKRNTSIDSLFEKYAVDSKFNDIDFDVSKSILNDEFSFIDANHPTNDASRSTEEQRRRPNMMDSYYDKYMPNSSHNHTQNQRNVQPVNSGILPIVKQELKNLNVASSSNPRIIKDEKSFESRHLASGLENEMPADWSIDQIFEKSAGGSVILGNQNTGTKMKTQVAPQYEIYAANPAENDKVFENFTDQNFGHTSKLKASENDGFTDTLVTAKFGKSNEACGHERITQSNENNDDVFCRTFKVSQI